jgi:serine/threonine protein kinase
MNKFNNDQKSKHIFKIGEGGFGGIFLLKCESEGKEVVIKIMDLIGLKFVFWHFHHHLRFRSLHRRIYLEYYFQRMVVSDYVVKAMSSFVDRNFLCIEMEYANGGSLIQLMQYCLIKKKLLDEKVVWDVFLHILIGLNGLIA